MNSKRKHYLKLSSIHMMIVLMMIMTSFSCSHTKTIGNSEQIIQGIPCIGEVEYFKNGKINICHLSKDFLVEGYNFPAGTELTFKIDGTPDHCRISKETKLLGQMYPAKTVFFFNRWGEKLSFWLTENTIIQGYLIGNSNDGPGTPLYPNGKLKEIWLENDQLIDSIPCTTSANIFKYGWHVMSLGTERRIKLYDNGHLQSAMLSEDITIQGNPYKKGDFIYLDKNGKIDLNQK